MTPSQSTGTETNRATTTEDLPADAQRLAAHLREYVEANGECYLKSRSIAEEIDLSPKQIGSHMQRLQHHDIRVTVEKWAYTNGTTWRVTSE